MEGGETPVEPQEQVGIEKSSHSQQGDVSSLFQGIQSIVKHYLHSLRSSHSVALETGDVEAIHKMRVSTRRLQAAIDLLQTGPNESRVAGVKRRLRRLRRALASVRSYDVFIAMVEQQTTGRRPSTQRYQNELVTAELHKRRAGSLLKVRQTLGSAHLGELSDKVRDISGIEKHSHHEPGGEEQGPVVIRIEFEMLRRRSVDRLEQRLAELQHLAAKVDASSSAESIHTLRIAAKRLRYLLELVSELGYGDATRTVEWLKVLQDRLGDLHDIDAFQQEVIDIVSRRKFLRKHMIESGGMLYAAARVVAGRESLCAKTFPVRVPLSVGATTRRLARSLSKAASSDLIGQPPETPEQQIQREVEGDSDEGSFNDLDPVSLAEPEQVREGLESELPAPGQDSRLNANWEVEMDSEIVAAEHAVGATD